MKVFGCTIEPGEVVVAQIGNEWITAEVIRIHRLFRGWPATVDIKLDGHAMTVEYHVNHLEYP